MSSYEDLQNLIKGLSGAEKRYVKVFSKRHSQKGKSDYLYLFERMDKVVSESEEELRASLPERILVKLPHLKHYLFHLIIRSLQSYTYEKTPEKKIISKLDKAQMLWERGLQTAAHKQLKAAQKLTLTYGKSRFFPQIFNLQRRFLKAFPERPQTDWQELDRREKESMQALKAETELLRLHDQMFVLLRRKRRALSPEVREEALSYYQKSKEINHLGGFEAQNYQYLIRAFYYHLILDLPEVSRTYAQLLQFWDAHPKVRESEQERYSRIFSVWLNYAILSGEGAEALQQIQALWASLPPKKSSAESMRLLLANNELFYYFNTGRYEQALENLSGLEAALGEISEEDPRKQSFLINVLHLKIVGEDFSGALRLLSKLDHRHDQWGDYLQPLYLLCQVEVGNRELLGALLRSWDRKLRIRGESSPWESLCLQFFKDFAKSENARSDERLFEALLTDLETFRQEKGQPRAMKELNLWAKSKLLRKSMWKCVEGSPS